MQLKDTLWVLWAIGTLAIQFWALKKPVETKLLILRLLLELSCVAAIGIAAYFLLATDKVTWWPLGGALYNFVIQALLFAISPPPIARRDILSVVFAAVTLAGLPVYGQIVVLAKAQAQISKAQSQMVENEGRMVSILEKFSKALGAIPSPSPSPTP